MSLSLFTRSAILHPTWCRWSASVRCAHKFKPKSMPLKAGNKMTKILVNDQLKRKPAEQQPVNPSTGYSVVGDEPGANRVLLTRRMKLLNKNFLQVITEILLTGDINQIIGSFGVRITQIQTTQDCKNLHVFYTRSGDAPIEEVDKKLKTLTQKIAQAIVDVHFLYRHPTIQFIYDLSDARAEELDEAMKNADFGEDFEPTDPRSGPNPYYFESKDVYGTVTMSKKFESFDEGIYSCLKMKKPPDMAMDTLGLDYEEMINIVLGQLNRSRANHRAFDAVADPLPPPDWVRTPEAERREQVYDTDRRIEEMKKFLVENRKKQHRMAREARKEEVLRQMLVDEEMNEAKERMDDDLEGHLQQNIRFDDDDYDYNA